MHGEGRCALQTHLPQGHVTCSTPAHSSDEKRKLWEKEQHRIALVADVPRIENCYCHYFSSHQNSAAQLDAHPNGDEASREAFVHRRFKLPDLQTVCASPCKTHSENRSDVPDADSIKSPQLRFSASWEALQSQLRFDATQQSIVFSTNVSIDRQLPTLLLVGGVDVSFIPNTNDGVACLAILRYPSMERVKEYMHRCTLKEPYISGFLAFRELQPVHELFESVHAELLATQTMPQLLLVDGNGVLHPRRCGLATHLGVTLDIPTIGCSKKMLQVDGLTRAAVEAALETLTEAPSCSSFLPRIVPLVGASLPHQLYGYAVLSHLRSVRKCIYVSPGHCVGFAVATALVITMLRHRIPEPIRAADLSSREFISKMSA